MEACDRAGDAERMTGMDVFTGPDGVYPRLREFVVGQPLGRRRVSGHHALEVLAKAGVTTPGDAPQVCFVKRTEAGASLFLVALPNGDDVVVKTAAKREAQDSIDREARVLRRLRPQPTLGLFRRVLPSVICEGRIDGTGYLVTSALPGCDASALVADPNLESRTRAVAADAARELHARTGRKRPITTDDVDRWSERHLRLLAAALRMSVRDMPIVRLKHTLDDGLVGRRTTISWIHGDYWCGNVLVSDDAGAVVGIIDWDLGEPAGLATTDLVHLVAMSRALAQNCHFGEVIAGRLRGRPWIASDAEMLENDGMNHWDGAYERSVLVLTWLRHVGANLGQSAAYARRRKWMRGNVLAVMQALDSTRGRDQVG
jgi:aminoglycoside phosphotransferase